jgi:hypothetical protein
MSWFFTGRTGGVMKKNSDCAVQNIAWITVVVCLETVQVLVVTVLAFQFVPIPVAPIAQGVVPQLLQLFKPKRDILFYRLGILEAMALQVAGCYYFRQRITTEDLSVILRPFACNLLFWLSLQIFAAFKLLQYHNPSWAYGVLYTGLAGSVLSQVFWPELIVRIKKISSPKQLAAGWSAVVGGGLAIFLFAVFYIPHAAQGLGMVFFYNHAASWDLIGPQERGRMLMLLTTGASIYFVAFFFFLNFWTRSVLMSLAGVLLAVKLNIFHSGQFPLAWRMPQATILRNVFDLGVLSLILCHVRLGRVWMLLCAGALTGFALAADLLTGISLLAAFYIYTFTYLARNNTPALQARACAAIPIAAAFFMMLLQGTGFPQLGEVWTRLVDGRDALPIYMSLYNRQFFAFNMAFIVPLVYIFSLFFVASLVLLTRMKWEDFFVIPVCVYGLGWYHGFLYRSAPGDYYAAAIPFVTVCLFWWQRAEFLLPRLLCVRLRWTIMCLALVALLTNVNYLIYPNAFNAHDRQLQQIGDAYLARFPKPI